LIANDPSLSNVDLNRANQNPITRPYALAEFSNFIERPRNWSRKRRFHCPNCNQTLFHVEQDCARPVPRGTGFARPPESARICVICGFAFALPPSPGPHNPALTLPSPL